ncbi:hypothetical protein GCM10017673_11570 [Streptosporangium violaceochromogenes]|nr:hypothetical protein GCM10017673_11570 [Streptosporangium violaceochromogenes]
MQNANSPTPGIAGAGAGAPVGAIPGWRIIVSDTGRLWASRVQPFPRETEWHAPPYRTVDADTLTQLQAEVERQEQAARELETTPGEATEQTGAGQPADQTATSGGGRTAPETGSGRVGT